MILANNWNRSVPAADSAAISTAIDTVNALDAKILFDWWGEQGGTFPGMMIPEPASATLFALGMLMAGPLRRRTVTSPEPC